MSPKWGWVDWQCEASWSTIGRYGIGSQAHQGRIDLSKVRGSNVRLPWIFPHFSPQPPCFSLQVHFSYDETSKLDKISLLKPSSWWKKFCYLNRSLLGNISWLATTHCLIEEENTRFNRLAVTGTIGGFLEMSQGQVGSQNSEVYQAHQLIHSFNHSAKTNESLPSSD